MQNRDEIIQSARTIRNFLAMGTPIGETLRDLADIQPKYRAQWRAIAAKCEGGAQLGSQIKAYGLWPESMIAAIVAGEESNSLEDILASIVRFNVRLKEINKTISTKIVTPTMFFLAGVFIFIGFMIFVLPGIAKPLKKKKDRQGLIAVSDFMVNLYTNHFVTVGAVFGTLVVGLVILARSQAFRDALFTLIDRMPFVGQGVREVYYGFWLQFMSILDTAGDIGYSQMVQISSAIIPNIYRPSMNALVRDATGAAGIHAAVNEQRWPPGDPRHDWPKMFKGVMRQSASLGKISESFEQAADPMIEEGQIKLNRALFFFNLLAMAMAALGIVAPMVGMMLTQLDVVNKMK